MARAGGLCCLPGSLDTPVSNGRVDKTNKCPGRILDMSNHKQTNKMPPPKACRAEAALPTEENL